MEPVTSTLLHGTSAHLLDTIKREGLCEPFSGRGVWLLGGWDRDIANHAAKVAALKHRDRIGSVRTVGEALIVSVQRSALNGLTYHAPTLGDFFHQWSVESVPPEALSFQTFSIALPAPSEIETTFLRRHGYATSTRTALGREHQAAC